MYLYLKILIAWTLETILELQKKVKSFFFPKKNLWGKRFGPDPVGTTPAHERFTEYHTTTTYSAN